MRCLRFALLPLLCLHAVSPANAWPEAVRQNACISTSDYPVTARFIDGTLRVDTWAAVNGLALKIMDGKESMIIFDAGEIKEHLKALMHEAAARRVPPSQLVDSYLTTTKDPLLQQHSKQFRVWADRFTQQHAILDTILKIDLDFKTLEWVLSSVEAKEDHTIGSGKVPLDEALTFARKQYDHYVRQETPQKAAIYAYFDVRQLSFQVAKRKNAKEKIGEWQAKLTNLNEIKKKRGYLTRRQKERWADYEHVVRSLEKDLSYSGREISISAADLNNIDNRRDIVGITRYMKSELAKRALNLPKKYTDEEYKTTALRDILIFTDVYKLENTLDDFVLNPHAFDGNSFINVNCPVNKTRNTRFAVSDNLNLELYWRHDASAQPASEKPAPEKKLWCGKDVQLDAVAADPAVYRKRAFNEMMQKVKKAVAYDCPQAEKMRLTGYMFQDTHPLYKSTWHVNGTKPVSAETDPALPLYERAAQEDNEAMFQIALRYGYKGWNDVWQGRFWLYRAAESGHSLAQAWLSSAYGPRFSIASGVGKKAWLTPDTGKALYWAKKSKDQGDPIGMWNYSIYLEHHYMGGFYSGEAFKRAVEDWKESSAAALGAFTKANNDELRRLRDDSRKILGNKLSMRAEIVLYRKSAVNACEMPELENNARYAPACQEILAAMKRIKKFNNAMSSGGGGRSCGYLMTAETAQEQSSGNCTSYGLDSALQAQAMGLL